MPLLIAGMTTIMYNKTLMDECGVDKVPTTYAELQDAAKKAKENGYVCIVAGGPICQEPVKKNNAFLAKKYWSRASG